MGEPSGGHRTVATNRKARHEYHILDQWEAGMVLTGPEVKSLREGKVGFQDAFARVDGGEVWLHNLHISPYMQANRWNDDPMRTRKLLLKSSEIRKLVGQVDAKGLALIPLEIYFKRGYAKVRIALARGKKLHDKRETLKRRTQERETRRAIDSGGGQ
ncbi:MAG: SsrA-binding protein SmpB [Gemmatimonadales bacterium]|nr:MAG: SsrA-binding protein SmpB [Gemmatimonadales bacterium]